MWSQSHEASPPDGIESFWQISWDSPLVRAAYNQLLSNTQSEASQSHLQAETWKESAEWLSAIPVTSLVKGWRASFPELHWD